MRASGGALRRNEAAILEVWTDPLQNRSSTALSANWMGTTRPEGHHLLSELVVRVVEDRLESQAIDPWMPCWLQRCCCSLLPQHWCSQADLAPRNGCN